MRNLDSLQRPDSEKSFQLWLHNTKPLKLNSVLISDPHQFSSVPLLSRVWLLVTPWTAARQASLSIANSRSLLKLMSIESVMPSTISSSVVPFSSCPQSLPASGSFPMSQLFAWGGQSIRVLASASVLPKNTQDWSLIEWTDWISLQPKGLSRVFSNTTVQKHQFLVILHFLKSFNFECCNTQCVHL